MSAGIDAGTIPPGFRPLPKGLGFSDVLQPSYIRVAQSQLSVAVLASEDHGNSMGIVHGGVLMTLADVAAAAALNHARGGKAGTPTLNLALDFIAAGNIGDWLQADVDQVSVKRRFGFASGVIRRGEDLLVRFNGTFYIPDHDGMWKQGQRPSVLDYLDD